VRISEKKEKLLTQWKSPGGPAIAEPSGAPPTAHSSKKVPRKKNCGEGRDMKFIKRSTKLTQLSRHAQKAVSWGIPEEAKGEGAITNSPKRGHRLKNVQRGKKNHEKRKEMARGEGKIRGGWSALGSHKKGGNAKTTNLKRREFCAKKKNHTN